MENDNKKIYSLRLDKFQADLDKVVKKNRTISLLRLVIFILAILLSFYFKSKGVTVILTIIGISIIPFLYLIKINVNLSSKIRYFKELIKINQNELKAIEGNISVFPSGKEFINPEHPYSYDLDLFGQESVYQLINRTCTGGGARKLANALESPLTDKKDIENRQKAVKELSPLLEWRQSFHATGNIVLEQDNGEQNKSGWLQTNIQNYSNDSQFHDEILDWLKEPYLFLNKPVFRPLLIILPSITILLFIMMISGAFPIAGFILYGIIQLFLAGYYMKKISRIDNKIGRKVHLLNKYGSLLKMIENQEFNSNILLENQMILKDKSAKASKSIEKLKSLVKALDNRNNILFAFIANAYFSWDIQVIMRMENWRKHNIKRLPEWLNVIYETDFLSSLATYSYNNPEYCIPEITEGDFYLKMEQAGHPLISQGVRIDNDLTINGHKQLLVITGANMAGKSTFLRTVGINMILSMIGSVVCAKKIIISPILLHTSIRTSDSIQKNESYFYAELKRLKSIIDRMQKGEKLFVIIDEMLRGTNSKDKHHGSAALIEQLIRLDGSGLLATHDIALGVLAEKYPDNVKNYRFEVEIKNNELVFDYLLKTGVSQNLNATFLMKKMGITV